MSIGIVMGGARAWARRRQARPTSHCRRRRGPAALSMCAARRQRTSCRTSRRCRGARTSRRASMTTRCTRRCQPPSRLCGARKRSRRRRACTRRAPASSTPYAIWDTRPGGAGLGLRLVVGEDGAPRVPTVYAVLKWCSTRLSASSRRAAASGTAKASTTQCRTSLSRGRLSRGSPPYAWRSIASNRQARPAKARADD